MQIAKNANITNDARGRTRIIARIITQSVCHTRTPIAQNIASVAPMLKSATNYMEAKYDAQHYKVPLVRCRHHIYYDRKRTQNAVRRGGGNYREIVNNIEYKCPYCTGGREKQKIKHYEVESGIVTNIRIALYGEREVVDRITHNHIRTNVLYSVTPHNAVDDYYDTDANSISKYEGELYATRADADATVESVKTVTTIDENGRQIK